MAEGNPIRAEIEAVIVARKAYRLATTVYSASEQMLHEAGNALRAAEHALSERVNAEVNRVEAVQAPNVEQAHG